MNSYSVSRGELLTHLSDQLDFMIASAISYDNGFEGEAKRLAATIRILVHDTAHSSALLTQLRKMDILFYDSASIFDPKNLISSNCLTMFRLSRKEGQGLEGAYVAPLEDLSPARNKDKRVGFGRWWKRNIVIKDKAGILFTRSDLILAVADKEGGAHIDPKLNQTYANLTRFNSLGWKVYTEGESNDLDNPVPPSIRQISHEVLKTLRDGALDLFSNRASLLKKFEMYDTHCQSQNKM